MVIAQDAKMDVWGNQGQIGLQQILSSLKPGPCLGYNGYIESFVF